VLAALHAAPITVPSFSADVVALLHQGAAAAPPQPAPAPEAVP